MAHDGHSAAAIECTLLRVKQTSINPFFWVAISFNYQMSDGFSADDCGLGIYILR
jgi:accessory gene regulator protein AgrB